MDCKSILASKTMWANVITGVLALIEVYQGQPWFPVQYQVVAVMVLNAALRMLTSQPVSLTGSGCSGKTLLVLALCCSLALPGCAGITAGQAVDPNQQRVALRYLQASLDAVKAAAETAKRQHPESAAQIDADVAARIAELQRAVEVYEISLTRESASGQSVAWATARAVLTTAVQVLGPYAINALVGAR